MLYNTYHLNIAIEQQDKDLIDSILKSGVCFTDSHLSTAIFAQDLETIKCILNAGIQFHSWNLIQALSTQVINIDIIRLIFKEKIRLDDDELSKVLRLPNGLPLKIINLAVIYNCLDLQKAIQVVNKNIISLLLQHKSCHKSCNDKFNDKFNHVFLGFSILKILLRSALNDKNLSETQPSYADPNIQKALGEIATENRAIDATLGLFFRNKKNTKIQQIIKRTSENLEITKTSIPINFLETSELNKITDINCFNLIKSFVHK